MTASMADRSAKTQKIRVIPVSHSDPDANRDDRIKVGSAIENIILHVRQDLGCTLWEKINKYT